MTSAWANVAAAAPHDREMTEGEQELRGFEDYVSTYRFPQSRHPARG